MYTSNISMKRSLVALNTTMTTTLLFLVIGVCLSFTPFIMSYSTTNATTNLPIDQDNNNKLNVVSSVAPITNIIQNIGGDKINLIGLVPEGVNSHTFEACPFRCNKD